MASYDVTYFVVVVLKAPVSHHAATGRNNKERSIRDENTQ